MNHFSLMTGHSRWSSRSEVNDRTIALIQPVARAGAGPLGDSGWFLQMFMGEAPGGAAFECHYGAPRRRGGLWIASCYMAWTQAAADEMWTAAMQNRPLVKKGIKRPALPWLAVAIMPDALTIPPALTMQLADLERCVGWAVVEVATGAKECA